VTAKAPSGLGARAGRPCPESWLRRGGGGNNPQGHGALLGALASLRTMQDGKVTITDKQIVLDCFAELVEAMLLS
jgi:hypothetical protein